MRIKRSLLAATAIAIPALIVALVTGGSIQAANTSPVLVTNAGAAQAVPVQVQGTATIAGNVSIANTPSVTLANSPTVNSQQAGAWNVGISGTPTVGLSSSANGVQAQQSGIWNVGITGIPTVALSSGNTTNIFDQLQTVVPFSPSSPAGNGVFGPIAVSAYRQIRVAVRLLGGGTSFQSKVFTGSSGSGAAYLLDLFNASVSQTDFTRVYDTPGEAIQVNVVNTSGFDDSVAVTVWGRTN